MGGRRVSNIMAGVDYDRKHKIANNTIEYWVNGERRIRLHNTDIVIVKSNGDIVLNSGGWKTVTTKDRMNAAIHPWGIYQDKGIWYLHHIQVTDRKTVTHGKVFADNMVLHTNNTISGHGPNPQKTYKLQKQIETYVTGFMVKLTARKIPQPSVGDCWFCCMLDAKTHKPLGEIIHDTNHIINHMTVKERYYVPALLMNAINTFPVSQVAKSQIGYWLKYHDQDGGGSWGNIAYDQIKKSLTRYMKRQLGIAT